MSNIKLIIAVLTFTMLVFTGFCFADEETDFKKAKKLHEVTTTSSVVQLKALYYQNNEIIGLLREIRDLLNSIKNELATQ